MGGGTQTFKMTGVQYFLLTHRLSYEIFLKNKTMAFICKISIVKNNITSRWRRLRHLRSKSTNHIREIKII